MKIMFLFGNQLNYWPWKNFIETPRFFGKHMPRNQFYDLWRTLYNCKYSEIGTCQMLWFNRLICSKSKKYFYYETWYDKNVIGISDLLNPPLPGHK